MDAIGTHTHKTWVSEECVGGTTWSGGFIKQNDARWYPDHFSGPCSIHKNTPNQTCLIINYDAE
jgi:hypothetical protein